MNKKLKVDLFSLNIDYLIDFNSNNYINEKKFYYLVSKKNK